MYEKNGVITEDRFKKMNHVQWWFHYKEIMRQKEKDIDQTAEILKVARNMFETLLDRLEMVGFMANPDLGSKLHEEKEKLKRQEGGEEVKDDLMSFFDEVKNMTPEIMSVNYEDTNKTKFILPKVKRKVGIEINDKAGD